MRVSLQQWVSNGWLVPHQTSRQEIGDLLGLADRDLADAETTGLSADWRLNIAYNAALQAITAALAAAGYRAARDAHHFRVIQSLQFTLTANSTLVAQLDQFRKKRNIGGYERAGAVSDQEAKEMFELARRIRADVADWLQANHPQLL